MKTHHPLRIKDLSETQSLGGVRFRYPGDGQAYYWSSQWAKGVWGKKDMGSGQIFPLFCDDLKDALLRAENAKVQGGGRPQSRGQGAWSSQGGTGILAPLSANPGILARPQTRNGQRSVAGEDYSSPVGYVKPPILHGLRSHTATGFRERPQTAPVGDNTGKIPANSGWFLEHTRVPGEVVVPGGKRTTGYCL